MTMTSAKTAQVEQMHSSHTSEPPPPSRDQTRDETRHETRRCGSVTHEVPTSGLLVIRETLRMQGNLLAVEVTESRCGPRIPVFLSFYEGTDVHWEFHRGPDQELETILGYLPESSRRYYITAFLKQDEVTL